MRPTSPQIFTALHMNTYLNPSEYINWNELIIKEKAQELAKGEGTDIAIAKACFLYVRDEIKHSWDYKLNPVTCKASDVLKHKTGYCYAKSHLLAALLRANGIPAGLCYQRLTIVDDKPPFCLHGLNAVYLKDYGWYRMDARGNKPGVAADFCPPVEKLAFANNINGEYLQDAIHAEPLEAVVNCLTNHSSYLDVAENLPDDEGDS